MAKLPRLQRGDYWRVGPVYVWKWLAVLLLLGGSLGVLAVLGPPSGLFAALETGPPAYRYDDRRLADISGVVRITDYAGAVRYEGEVSQGAYTGTGRVYDAGGRLVYSGPLVDGVYEGAGARLYAGGVLIYEGDMSAGVYEGQGRRICPDSGLVSQGQFSAGVLEGEGREFYPDGTLLRAGTFSNDLLNGEGREYGPDGTLLRAGTFADGLLHGEGAQYASGGSLLYQGAFQRGLYHGQGILYNTLWGSRAYEGEFVEGRAVGLGRIFHPSGQLLYEGNVYDGAPRADAFLGLSLAEVEAAFAGHWLLYSCGGSNAFVYPWFHLMFWTDSPIELVPPTGQDQGAEEGPAKGRGLSGGTVKADVRITEVLSYGEPLPGVAQPDTLLPSGERRAGWRERFSSYAAGERPDGGAAVQTGSYLYEFTPLPAGGEAEIPYYLASGGGVRSTTVLREDKDGSLWYQSAVREEDMP